MKIVNSGYENCCAIWLLKSPDDNNGVYYYFFNAVDIKIGGVHGLRETKNLYWDLFFKSNTIDGIVLTSIWYLS